MATFTTEQELRREAIRRHVLGEAPREICRDLDRSESWFDKWWAEYRQNPATDFADHSRAPHTSPQQTPAAIEQAIVTTRQTLEAASTPETKYGLIGAPAVRQHLEGLGIGPLPSDPTIQRIMARHDLTQPIGAGSEAAYYPWPVAWGVDAIHATDIITRYVYGGEAIHNFHTIDLYSHAAQMTQHADKSSATTCTHLVNTWSKLGRPLMQQLDNEGAFCGGHTHPHIIGRVVRLCLFCGIEPIFTPVYEPKRNYQIESFHSLWVAGFWTRNVFTDLRHVQTEVPTFAHWYHTVYHPPALPNKTPAQMRQGVTVKRLTRDLRHLIPNDRLPITNGRIHLMRKVDATGHIKLLNETWLVGIKWIGEYVRATVDTARQQLTMWHQADADTDWRLIKTRQFQINEEVHSVLPQFRRNSTRCRDYWPG
jgi:transposase-like protein